jgi:16S rRNA (guanine1207-N2)-methyltransferase
MNTVKRPDDPHYKATLSVASHRARLQFHVAQDLFSSAGLDPGTAALLRTLAGPDYTGTRRILDLGCGYGPLGLFLKAWEPARTVHLVDRDQLAVRFAGMNVELNGFDGVEAYASLGYDDLQATDFDLVAANIPAKAGPQAIESFLLDGQHFLSGGGTMAVVVINRLAPDVRATLEQAQVEVVLQRENRGYTCWHYRYPDSPTGGYEPAFAGGVYDRGLLRHAGVEITTAYGLPEFDTPGFATQLAIKLLPTLQSSRLPVVLNPGQGLVPAVWARPVVVDDRDLLAVHNTARNALVVDDEPDAVIAMLRDHEPLPVTLAALRRYTARRVLVAGTSTQVTRLVEALGGDVIERKRNHGFSAATIDMRT